MSAQIMASVPPPLALWNISQIDEHCEETSSLVELQIQRGPFGAFRIPVAPPGATNDIEGGAFQPIEQLHAPQDNSTSPSEPTWSADTQEAIAMLFQDYGFDSWDMSPGARIQEILDEAAIPQPTEQNLPMHPEPLNSDAAQGPSDLHTATAFNGNAISRVGTPATCPRIDVPQSAWVLLKHYLGTVLKSLTPYRHSKTPWHILFVPLVKNCLAGLALQEEVDHASRCVFYGTLAISAASLSGTSQSPEWERKSTLYAQQARTEANFCLASAYGPTKTAKYKNQLMAILTMAQVSITTGNRDETEYYLLEAERLIRVRGLNRKKSRKVRLLHHCYAYERIFFESTARGKDAHSHTNLRKAIESSGAGVYSRDSLSFQMPTCENLESEMLKVKDQDQGENDLHLQIPGVWPSTLYPEIFGIPEEYVLLVSLIVRLSREKNSGNQEGQRSGLGLKAFASRAKTIEKCIKQQHQSQRHPTSNEDLEHMIEAVHHAVLIFFYRRIHDVDASMLQQQVSTVRDCLIRYEAANTEEGYASVRLMWPAFVAACEAEDAATQAYFAGWFDKASRRTGLRLFDMKLAEIEQVWQNKRNELGTDCDYLNLVMDDYPPI